jgi:hypothetical protein
VIEREMEIEIEIEVERKRMLVRDTFKVPK